VTILYILSSDFIGLVEKILKAIGIEDWLSQLIIGLLALIIIIGLIGKQALRLFQYWVAKRQEKYAARDLHPFFSRGEIAQATKYYIPTQFQNVSPSEDEEPGRSYVAAARQPLIPLFLNKSFKDDSDHQKYYLILADSGMGKTTFMINLYLKYRSKRQFPWHPQKYQIKLFPLAHPETLDQIAKIPDNKKNNCILLLDAFDEDNKAVVDYKSRLQEILDLTWEFREIVITCRTQFFPNSNSEPTETGLFKFGPKGGQHHFQKLYLSVFSKKDIKKYLKKRYPHIYPFLTLKYIKALSIVLKSPNLMMRPMLLSYIEDLISSERDFEYGFQIYETLIDQWLQREASKPGIIVKYGNTYKTKLFEFSKALARNLYVNRKDRDYRLSLRAEELIDNPNGLQLKDIEGNTINLEAKEQASRSLLNRNAIGEYKFSHKSIFEYFLTLEIENNASFRDQFYFDSDLDTSKKFLIEKLIALNGIDRNQKTNKLFKKVRINGLYCAVENMGITEKELENAINKQTNKNVFVAFGNIKLGVSVMQYLLWMIGMFSLAAVLTSVFTESQEINVIKYKSLNMAMWSIIGVISFAIGFYQMTINNALKKSKSHRHPKN